VLLDVLIALVGWFITALAATLGAPFWFDVLNKVMVIRSTVKPKEKSPDEASEDRAVGKRQGTGSGQRREGGEGDGRDARVAADGAVG
jgi:hypothetical protein